MAPKFLRDSLSVLTVSLLLAISASGQIGGIDPDPADKGTGGTTTLSGNVYLPTGQMLDRRIRVRLSAPTWPELSTLTDDNGAFSFHRLSSGSYTVLIDEKEYEPVSEHIEISQRAAPGGNAGQTITVQIQLRYKPKDGTRPAVISSDFANVPPEALDCYRQALQLAQAGDSKAAIEELHKAISIYGHFVMALNELGVQYMRLGDFEHARQSLESALKISPDAFILHLNRGILFVVSNRCKESEPDLRRAIALNENSALAHYYLGRALARLRKFDEAETQLLRALTLKPDDVKEAHRYLGAIYNDRGDDAHALHELETYLQLVPNAKDAEQIRGIIQQLKQSLGGSRFGD
jgi:Flp pilus assembly protein TadD